MNKIHKAMLKMAQDSTIKDPAPKGILRFENAWQALSLKFSKENAVDYYRLRDLIKQFEVDKNQYTSKLNANQLEDFNSSVAAQLNSEIPFAQPFMAEEANAIIAKDYNKIKLILQNAFEEVTGPTLKSTKTNTIDGSWTVSFWKKLIQGLYKRAKNQENIARTNLESATSDMQKKKFGIILKSKENYVAYIQNLAATLDQASKNKSPSDRLSDSLLGSSSESVTERGSRSRRSRSDVARGYESDYEGEDKLSQEDYSKSHPFEKGNNNIRIKNLLKAYGLAGDYSLLMETDSPEILNYEIWAGSWDKQINKDLEGVGLEQIQRGKYVYDLRKALIEMRRLYINHMESKKQETNPGQIKLFQDLIASLTKVLPSFHYTPESKPAEVQTPIGQPKETVPAGQSDMEMKPWQLSSDKAPASNNGVTYEPLPANYKAP